MLADTSDMLFGEESSRKTPPSTPSPQPMHSDHYHYHLSHQKHHNLHPHHNHHNYHNQTMLVSGSSSAASLSSTSTFSSVVSPVTTSTPGVTTAAVNKHNHMGTPSAVIATTTLPSSSLNSVDGQKQPHQQTKDPKRPRQYNKKDSTNLLPTQGKDKEEVTFVYLYFHADKPIHSIIR